MTRGDSTEGPGNLVSKRSVVPCMTDAKSPKLDAADARDLRIEELERVGACEGFWDGMEGLRVAV